MQGNYFEGGFTSTGVKPNMSVKYKIFIPEVEGELGLVFSHDGFNTQAAEAMNTLCEEGKVPPCVFIGVWPGTLSATLKGGFDRWMRMDNYDVFDPSYPRFVVCELIPYILEKYGLKVSASPNMHMVLGGSSGGISSFNIAWFESEYFHRVYTSSPSFLSMSNGREMPALIRKCETKPLRVWIEYSENEPDDYFGSSYAAAIDFLRALSFAGYDIDSRYFAGEGHCSRYYKVDSFKDAFEFLWKNWASEPITALHNSKRFSAIFGDGNEWTICDSVAQIEKKRVECALLDGEYIADGTNIYFEKGSEKKLAATFDKNISVIKISSDGWRLYVGGREMPCVYAMNIMPGGKLEGKYIHGSIHRYTDFAYAGITDMCVGNHDRIYAMTEIGVQCIRPFGLIDVIAPLPDKAIGEGIYLNMAENRSELVAITANSAYSRPVTEPSDELKTGEPKPNSYYD